MKKTLFLLFAILLISQYFCDDETYCEDKNGVKGKKDCNGLKLYEGREDNYTCCYVKVKVKAGGKSDTAEFCEAISKANYDRIKDFIKDSEKEMESDGEGIEWDIKKYDCFSNYLYISIMSLILFLLL